MNSIVVEEPVVSSYVIQAEGVAESKITTVKYVTGQVFLKELVDYFSSATKLLRQKRHELFQE